MLRRLYHDQPESFAFTPENLDWARAQITKFPKGREASAVIPLLWRAQEQEGWLSRPAIEHVADMLGMAHIRALEVATFYFMFQLQPVGSVANIQVCGTTTCMICGAEDLIKVCREKIAPKPHMLSADGKFSWEEVECLGACTNAPMVQIGKDFYEDLTAERFAEILDELASGDVPTPGPQNGRYGCEPLGGPVVLTEFNEDAAPHNASVSRALEVGDTIKHIDGTEVPLLHPWTDRGGRSAAGGEQPEAPEAEVPDEEARQSEPTPGEGHPISEEGITKQEADADSAADVETPVEAQEADGAAAAETMDEANRPQWYDGPRGGTADDLKEIKGIGPKLEEMCHSLGFYHFDQIAAWTPEEVTWVDQNLEGFKGRVTRDDWVGQARALAAGNSSDE
ncbi:NADH-quinone oxidoreductase subunit E [Tropicimonas isoalkanivorans]|uniref:NADH dehydrogenase subunit E n=1 Tax=Tropicimonas isoalkanivorans TaxID=441112 RepID=A0A1I1DM32_9RHOB|nr:NADH-quinone oxidoreductase subunit E [Tropicimonas isoalkanivorans]SFB75951.1 NADH dehydrogenase subunit E [Tropicimonas isoalkanivorans]